MLSGIEVEIYWFFICHNELAMARFNAL